MMRNVFSIILRIIAGFLFYMVSLLGFINEPSTKAKWWMILGFTLVAILALGSGLALQGFRNGKRNAGTVLVWSSGVTVFIIFSFACMLMTEEFRMMMDPQALTFFDDYATGSILIVGLAIIGWLLIKSNNFLVRRPFAAITESSTIEASSRKENK